MLDPKSQAGQDLTQRRILETSIFSFLDNLSRIFDRVQAVLEDGVVFVLRIHLPHNS
jgi:hypothetical protein